MENLFLLIISCQIIISARCDFPSNYLFFTAQAALFISFNLCFQHKRGRYLLITCSFLPCFFFLRGGEMVGDEMPWWRGDWIPSLRSVVSSSSNNPLFVTTGGIRKNPCPFSPSLLLPHSKTAQRTISTLSL